MNCKIFIILAIAAIEIAANNTAMAQNPTFVQQENIKIAGIFSDAQISPLTVTQKQTTRQYIDGLGRAIQTVAIQASPLQNDIIQPIVYDNLGRQIKRYMPYTAPSTDVTGSYRSNAISTEQPAFYNNTNQYLIAKDSYPYSQQVFENSPLQRILQSGMVGNGFQPVGGTGTQHYKTVNYRSNTSGDGNILVWNTDGTYTAGIYYAANTLAVTDGKDEDNVETLSFADLAGHTILVRQILGGGNLDTYYIYNDAGMLSYTIPPLATNSLAANSYNLTVTPLSNLIFKYVYDSMGRLVEKTVPAKGTIYMVYDPINRPVLVQDTKMLAANQWNYIKYDAKGRAISQGIYIDATSTRLGRVNMQTYITSLASAYNTAWYETRSGTLTNGGYYTSAIFPTATTGTLTPLAYSYYDDYDLNQDGSSDFSYIAQGLTNEETATTAQLKGMPTIISKTTVGSGIAANTWLTTITFYDKRGNPIQTQSNNQVYYTNATTLTDVSTTVPDFMGIPQISKASQKTSSSVTVTVQTNLTYDQMNRMTAVSQAYNGGTLTQVAAYSYNELGQVIKKGLGYVNSTTWLQNLDMRYNIRGQLLSINNSKLTSDAGVTNSDANDVFGMQMLYDGTDSNLSNTPYFNGKLSAVKWMSKSVTGVSTYERAYKYNYDGVNRYTGEVYAERTTTGTGNFSNNLDGFDETVSSYDAGGNIINLNRNASTQGTNTNTQIDKLTYAYDSTNPYRLLTVSDAATVAGTASDAGFVNYTHSAASYQYDVNGNLSIDPYKGLNIGYDVLNRTDKITVTTSTNRWIDFTYDANGSLIRKRQYDNNTLQNTTDYVNGVVYINSILSYFPMPEGRVINTGGATVTLKQEFIISDQQGNARLSFKDNGSGAAVVTQENSYYGYGLVMPNSPVNTMPAGNKKLYNGGSEWQNDFTNLPDYYQTFNRNYDQALARFVGVDPKAESATNMTSYQYAGDNPIFANDPLGDVYGEGNTNHNSREPAVYVNGHWVAAFNGEPGYDRTGNNNNNMRQIGDPGVPAGDIGLMTPAQWLKLDQTADLMSFVQALGNFVGNYQGSLNQTYTNSRSGPSSITDLQNRIMNGIPLQGDQTPYPGPINYIMNAGHVGNSNSTSSANQGGGTPYYDGLNKVNAIAGSSTILGLTGASVGYLKAGSVSLNWYSSGWGGGSRALIKTAQLSKLAETVGRVGVGIGFVADTYEFANGNISGSHYATNTVMGGIALTPVGFVTIPYFVIDAYYPGGFTAAMHDSAPLYNQMNQPNAAPPQVLMGMP